MTNHVKFKQGVLFFRSLPSVFFSPIRIKSKGHDKELKKSNPQITETSFSLFERERDGVLLLY